MANSEDKEQDVALKQAPGLVMAWFGAILAGCKKRSTEVPSDSPRATWASCRVGDVFAFGNYPQGAEGEIKPIEWQVLRRDKDGLLVMSKYALDCRQYHYTGCDITWSQCTLRKWLNNEFINKAFDATERQQIKEMHLHNHKGVWNNVPGGPDTDDKIFLLSLKEVVRFFRLWLVLDSEQLKCKPTEFTVAQGASTDNGVCGWWLRSPGGSPNFADYVYTSGHICYHSVVNLRIAVRPAMKIAL